MAAPSRRRSMVSRKAVLSPTCRACLREAGASLRRRQAGSERFILTQRTQRKQIRHRDHRETLNWLWPHFSIWEF